MKITKFLTALLLVSAALLSSCNKDESIKLYDLTIRLSYPSEGTLSPYSGATVELRETNGTGVYESQTTADGTAFFQVPAGVYEATTSDTHVEGDYYYICNGVIGGIIVDGKEIRTYSIEVKTAKITNRNPIIIKEIYNGGVMLDDNSKNFQFDKCVILYNNSSKDYTAQNLAISMAPGYNAEAASNSKLFVNGVLEYDNSDYLPGYNGIWYFQNDLVIPAFSQIVVNICGAIDNTQTVTNSVNYANADYYCMYDPEYEGGGTQASNKFYNNTSYYPDPADVIPTSHYLKTVKLGQGNAWPFSVTSPAVFIYQTEGTTPKAAAENADNDWYHTGYATTAIYKGTKVLRSWIVDGVEVWNSAKLDGSYKRLPADIDAGHVNLTNQLGHALYRNVDKAATEALPENNGLLVYNYSLGVDASTDPSGIDAEASIKNGAHIIFVDTNNSTNDFHERQKCSLRGE